MKVWFNRCFSTAFNLISELKTKHPGEFTFYISHPDVNSINLQIADYCFEELKVEGREYVNYCLDICKLHSIELFIPYHNSDIISKYVDEFEAIGTKVIVAPNNEAIKILNNKGMFYEAIKKNPIYNIPNHKIVNTPQEFIEASKKLLAEDNICFKPTKGVGAIGFKIVRKNDTYNCFDDFISAHGRYHINEKLLFDSLKNVDTISETMVMEYLDGKEVIVDVLADKAGNFIYGVPRLKTSPYTQELFTDDYLVEVVKSIAEQFKVPYTYNVQFIYKKGIPHILEVNTRISGGCYLSEMSGVQFLYNSMMLAMDKPIIKAEPVLDIKFYKYNNIFKGVSFEGYY